MGLVFVANVQGKTTPLDDYETDSIVTEFLSNTELDEFVVSLEKAGIYHEIIHDEEGFLEWMAHGRLNFGRPQPIVYNLAQNGTGPARLSLVPGLCRLHHIPLLDSDGYVVALTQHKHHSAAVMRQSGLPVMDSWLYTEHGWQAGRPDDGLKIIAKPSYDSASIGIHSDSVFCIDDHAEQRLSALVRRYRQPFTVQQFISGHEIEVPVFGGFPPTIPMAVGIALRNQRNLQDSILIYDDVFSNGYAFYDFSTESSSFAKEMIEIARAAYSCLGFKGAARIDFRIGADGLPKIMEVACKPHLTKHSSFMHVMEAHGHSHEDLMKYLVGEAVSRLYSADQNWMSLNRNPRP